MIDGHPRIIAVVSEYTPHRFWARQHGDPLCADEQELTLGPR